MDGMAFCMVMYSLGGCVNEMTGLVKPVETGTPVFSSLSI